jgi:hypothetical protein
VCGDLFVPDVRTRGLQKVCGKPACRRERKRLADTRWRSANPGYRDQDKMRRWAEEYPNYWLAWRAAHPAYVERNRQQTRERVRASRLLFAKQDATQRDPVGYLEGRRAEAMFAKQDAMIPRLIEGILTFLTLREVFAKPKTIDSIPAVMASSGP